MTQPDRIGHAFAMIGVGAHLVLGMVALSRLAVPSYGIVLIAIGWLFLLAQGLSWWAAKPRLVILIPVAGLAWWAFVLWLGNRFLSWPA